MELSVLNATQYLASRGLSGPYRIAELGGGVSNTVLLAEGNGGRIILKQALEKLRVKEDWYSDRRRIFRESAALRWLAPRLPAGSLPKIRFEDRDNFLFAMTCAPGSESWKEQLLNSSMDPEIAAVIGQMLAIIANVSWHNPECEAVFGDQAVFDQLRIDPYYRTTAARHPDVKEKFQQVMDSSRARRVCLVHGDWSPKNFLVAEKRVMAIDFEVIHYGDPAFDSAFMLNHLLLKSFHRPQCAPQLAALARVFWATYSSALPQAAEWLERATLDHLGCLLLARIDGKSPAEYLRKPEVRDRVRRFAKALIFQSPESVAAVFARL